MRARLLDATVELPGRARLQRYVDHAGQRAGGGRAGVPSCTTSRPRTTWCRRRRAPHRGARRRARGGRGRAADRAAADPRRAPHARRPLHRRRSSPRRSSSGSPPAPTRPCSPRSRPLEQRVGRETHRLTVELLGADESRPGVRELVQATLDLVRGLGLANTITDDARRRARILDRWADTLDDALEEPHERPPGRPARRPRRPRATSSGHRVAGSTRPAGRTPTPAAGWDIATQIAHLPGPTRSPSCRAPTDKADVGRLVIGGAQRPGRATSTRRRHEVARLAPEALLARWRAARGRSARRCASCPTGQKIPWFGPPMSAASMATARFMETWAHGQDVHDALGVEPEPTDRIRHVAHLGVRTRDYAFAVHGLDAAGRGVPGRADRAVAETLWTWGPEDAAQPVTGSAYDFCLLVTQRVHRDDTDLVAVGEDAEQWLEIAQAFAGPPGPGREASRFDVAEPPTVGSATAPASTATGSPRCGRCSTAVPLDVLTGDYLAELTMLILGKDQLKDPSLGYARTFLRQVEDCLGLALEQRREDRQQRRRPQPRRPRRPAARGRAGPRARRRVAHVEGDDLRAARARRRAHRERLPRRLRHRRGPRRAAPTSSSPAGSPTPRWWSARRSRTSAGPPTSYDELAGAVVAGHVLECGTQATGGNFSGFHCRTTGPARSGFPLAEIAADGSQRDHQARRHRRRGHGRHGHRAAGLRDPVRPATSAPTSPPASTRQAGPGRPRPGRDHRHPRRAPPPERLKVGVNELGGFRNTVEFVLTGLDIEAKAAWVRDADGRRPSPRDARPSTVAWARRAPHADADTEEAASCLLRCTVKDARPDPVGKAFTPPLSSSRWRRPLTFL